MADSKSKAEEKLEKLAAVVKKGWAKAHALTPEQKQAVAKTVRQEWTRIQSNAPKPSPQIKKSPTQERDGPELGRG